MTQPTNPVNRTAHEPPTPTHHLTPEITHFLQTAGVVTKVFVGGISALCGVACICVSFTLTPFSSQTGMATFALGISFFALAAFCFSNTPSLASRDVQVPNS